MPSFTGDAEIVPFRFTGDAWVISTGRATHHRQRDHFGPESALYVVLEEQVGKYVADTPIHFVLEDLVARMEALENGEVIIDSFTGDAWIIDTRFTGDAVILVTDIVRTFTGDAWVTKGGSFTGDAVIVQSFTGDAYFIP